MDFLPYILLALSIILNGINKKLASFLFFISLATALFFERINFIGLTSLFLTAISFWIWKIKKDTNKTTTFFSALVFFILAFSLSSHQMPGFFNLKFFDNFKLSENSAPFSMYLNFDKPYLSALCFYYLKFDYGFKNKGFWKNTFLITVVTIVLLLGPAFIIDYIQFEFKFKFSILVWALNNLIFVCIAEELVFRRLIQNDLKNLMLEKNINLANWFAIFIAASIFGLAHYKGGINYILLSTLAGVCYGFAYDKLKSIEASIFVHFGVNLFHILFLTYPYTLHHS